MDLKFEQKIWLIFRSELIDIQTLENIKADFIALMPDTDNIYHKRAVANSPEKIVAKFINYSGQSFGQLTNDLETLITNTILNRIS